MTTPPQMDTLPHRSQLALKTSPLFFHNGQRKRSSSQLLCIYPYRGHEEDHKTTFEGLGTPGDPNRPGTNCEKLEKNSYVREKTPKTP